eukprot:8078732-Pyramimonas_sp.AAC.1
MHSEYGIVEDNTGHLYTTFWAMFSKSVLLLGFVSCIFSPAYSLPQSRVDGGIAGEAGHASIAASWWRPAWRLHPAGWLY